MSRFTGSFLSENSSIFDKNQTKTDFSTFIEEIESTTDKLISEVFSTPMFFSKQQQQSSHNSEQRSYQHIH